MKDIEGLRVELEVLRLVAELEEAAKTANYSRIRYAANLLKAHLTSNKEYLSEQAISKIKEKLKQVWGLI